MSSKKEIRYEDSAIHKSGIVGWVCTECDRYWGTDEHMARYCCSTSFPCKCGKRRKGCRTLCEECIEKRRRAKWDAKEKHPWPSDLSVNPVVVQGDRYFFDEGSWLDWIEDELGEFPDLDLIDLEPEIAEAQDPPLFDLNDWLHSYLPEDDYVLAPPDDEINKLIREHAPKTFFGTGKAIDVSTIPMPSGATPGEGEGGGRG